jgi:hypothetical protein
VQETSVYHRGAILPGSSANLDSLLLSVLSVLGFLIQGLLHTAKLTDFQRVPESNEGPGRQLQGKVPLNDFFRLREGGHRPQSFGRQLLVDFHVVGFLLTTI